MAKLSKPVNSSNKGKTTSQPKPAKSIGKFARISLPPPKPPKSKTK